jgi:hypothetical protein
LLILKRKVACLFFDQINNYANFRGASHLRGMPSTDLSTVIVDKYVQSEAFGRAMEWPLWRAQRAHMMRGPVFGIEILGSRQQIRVQGVAMRLP